MGTWAILGPPPGIPKLKRSLTQPQRPFVIIRYWESNGLYQTETASIHFFQFQCIQYPPANVPNQTSGGKLVQFTIASCQKWAKGNCYAASVPCLDLAKAYFIISLKQYHKKKKTSSPQIQLQCLLELSMFFNFISVFSEEETKQVIGKKSLQRFIRMDCRVKQWPV
jgi:hypothetical protein